MLLVYTRGEIAATVAAKQLIYMHTPLTALHTKPNDGSISVAT